MKRNRRFPSGRILAEHYTATTPNPQVAFSDRWYRESFDRWCEEKGYIVIACRDGLRGYEGVSDRVREEDVKPYQALASGVLKNAVGLWNGLFDDTPYARPEGFPRRGGVAQEQNAKTSRGMGFVDMFEDLAIFFQSKWCEELCGAVNVDVGRFRKGLELEKYKKLYEGFKV